MNLDPTVQITIVIALTVLVLALVFRDRIEELVFGREGAKLKLSKKEEEEAREEGVSKANEELNNTPLDWSRTGELFWLGNDIMWTKMVIAYGSKKEILEGLTNTLLHVKALGLHGTYADEKLQQFRSLLVEWPEEHLPRKDLYQHLESVKQYIASLAEANESLP